MKKIIVVIGTILAMLVIMIFPCYGEPLKDENGCYKACYQKNNGQLRVLTGHKDECRQNAEVSFPLCSGGQIPKVPIICAAYIAGSNCDTTTNACPFTGSCVSSVSRTSGYSAGYYDITFTGAPTQKPPICVISPFPLDWSAQASQWTKYSTIYSTVEGTSGFTGITVITTAWPYPYEIFGEYDTDFNFICTWP